MKSSSSTGLRLKTCSLKAIFVAASGWVQFYAVCDNGGDKFARGGVLFLSQR